ncbi:hypothetical protein C8R46DRAFT_438378 [Mycena filopes]|nr:hypothetical protein C8R46DRAFT_438378 [Mycena filopes]
MPLLRPLRVVSPLRWTSARFFHDGHSKLEGSRTLISTLNPRLLKSSDYHNFSGRHSVAVAPVGSSGPGTRFRYTFKKGTVPFPENAAGFLYCHRDPHAAPLECALRFRLATSRTRTAFAKGRDLLLPTGLPWQVILPQLTDTNHIPLADQLVREGLVTLDQIERCRALSGGRQLRPALTLFRLGQAFPVDFAKRPTLTFVGEDRLWPADLLSLFYSSLDKTQMRPFTGSGTARFEPARVDGERVVHLRILTITHPVTCVVPDYSGRLVEPKAGELLSVTSGGRVTPWAYSVDRDTMPGAAFRALWTPEMP